ncbi:hypothetical protein V6N11_044853 [Hibiscus sabdariffa]|uniref:Uncharacterized protein n=2 Tax=Hibiscus sabdariffa TaxID=183260 RepID=A0ABR2PU20_9ROSI
MATNVGGSSGPAKYTNVTLQNNTDDNLMLSGQKDWYGSANPPAVIQAKSSAEFKHEASSGSSKGGVVYSVENGIKWIIAWSNMEDESNKVYIDITKDAVDWFSIELLLANSTSNPPSVTKFGFTATATIQPDSSTPSLTANLKKD